MDVLYKRCAGLDVHKDSVVACVRLADGPTVVRGAVSPPNPEGVSRSVALRVDGPAKAGG